MVIVREKKKEPQIKEVERLYLKLANLFTRINLIVADWSLLAEGIELAEAATPQDARRALEEIRRCLADLGRAERENRFNDIALIETYREALGSCSLCVSTIVGSLRAIWSDGDPTYRTAPFGETTNYKFVVRQLVRFADETNAVSSRINVSVKEFNRNNRSASHLPAVPIITVSQKVRNLSR